MKHIYALGMGLVFCANLFAQYGDLGMASAPQSSDLIEPLIYYGEVNDFSGGYHIGDTVPNFTIYDFDGNAFNLYESLAGDKPVVMVNGSLSCLRFRQCFDPAQPGDYQLTREFIANHQDDFNWVFLYNVEAHPTDGNCPSNCPPTINTDTTVLQHPDYHYRMWAAKTWMEAPEFDFPYNMYLDNPDNAVYNNFFQRAFGLVAFNCDGTVALRADWTNSFIGQASSLLLDLSNNYTTCTIDWPVVEEEEEEEEVNSVTESSFAPLTIYPNPAHDEVHITASVNDRIWIVDLTGQEVLSAVSGTTGVRIDVSTLTSGVYFVKTSQGTQRLVIQH
ncbi:MAG: hypothetical protein RL226_1970 [Bacteroidota bacterium]|jgi:hypothetical protein